ncbi:MAG: hypothetical protein JWO03_1579 [Bacteroidetes bacterium]|nr:hypothetical protein [Bacteroidota bacterium]
MIVAGSYLLRSIVPSGVTSRASETPGSASRVLKVSWTLLFIDLAVTVPSLPNAIAQEMEMAVTMIRLRIHFLKSMSFFNLLYVANIATAKFTPSTPLCDDIQYLSAYQR